MTIGPPEIHHRNGRVRIEAPVSTAAGRWPLWYEVDARFAPGLVTTRLDGFAVAGLLVALERGERELVLEGPVSERLLHNLRRQLGPVLRLGEPTWHDVAIRAAAVDSTGRPQAAGVGTGFSGGVDAFATIAEYLAPEQTPTYRLTHLFFCDVGAHGRGQGGRKLAEARWALLRDFGASAGLETVRVDSNLDDFVETDYERTHIPRLMSAALLLQGLIGKYLLSSTLHIRDWQLPVDFDAVAHLLSTEAFTCLSVVGQHTRVERTRLALRLPDTRRLLNVCVTPGPGARNCSECHKCLRTLATLDLLGVLDEFDRVFDVALYRRRHRTNYLLMLPNRTDDPFIREIYDFARTPEGRGRLPGPVARVHDAWPLIGAPLRAAKSVRRRLRR